jgi:large subunit ribosomal protein L23
MDGIKCFITSKKALSLIDNKKYSFVVQRWIDKKLIKRVIEDFFGVKVLAVNTFGLPKKQRRLGKFKGYKTNYRKAIVTIDPKDNIQLFVNI